MTFTVEKLSDEFILLNSCQYSYYASNIYVRFGPILESDIPEIRPFDRVTDIPFNFLLLAKVSDEKLKEYLVNFEKFLISILKKELFSWRFKFFCLNKKILKDILCGRSHCGALSQYQATVVSTSLLDQLKVYNLHLSVVAAVFLPEFIIFLGMNLFDSNYDDIDNKLSNFFMKKNKNLKNIIDYYMNENVDSNDEEDECIYI